MKEIEALDLAIKIASDYHYKQVDKSGQPYILHPLSVMMKMDTVLEKTVAVLHDIVEDTECTLHRLKTFGFSGVVISAIDSISRREFESVDSYYNRIIINRIATKVKIADLEHNMAVERLLTIRGKDIKRIRFYHEQWKMLNDRLNNHFNVYGERRW